MGNGRSPDARLVLTLTHACNLRCPYCPLQYPSGFMEEATAERAAALFFERRPSGKRLVKFFGGEPMLSFPLLRRLVAKIRKQHGGPNVSFFVSTNATLLDDDAADFFADNPDIEVALSAVPAARLRKRLPNWHLNIAIPPPLAPKLPRYVASLAGSGIRRMNFLPGYYLPWTKEQRATLERSFQVTAGLLRRLGAKGTPVDVINVRQWAPTPLYNHGMVVGPEGDIYPTNLAFASDFLHLQPELKLGNVNAPAAIRWDRSASLSWDGLLRAHMDPAAYDSTLAVDASLTRFVERVAA